MKKQINLIFISFVFLGINLSFSAQVEEIKFLVNGNCTMCKNRIETALNIKGIELADWDLSTHMCTISYNSDKIKEDNIHRRIALAGHDTPKYKAEEVKYQKLKSCCQYKRIYAE
ncbi:MAG: heavy-metal-associated domain-containing protein [Flavobacteriales bacterium]|nr:heavy-metal-associated domain-containing protein [Flavobacteriales bacterium]